MARVTVLNFWAACNLTLDDFLCLPGAAAAAAETTLLSAGKFTPAAAEAEIGIHFMKLAATAW